MKKKSEPGLALLSPASLVLALVGLSGLVSSCYGLGSGSALLGSARLGQARLGRMSPALAWPGSTRYRLEPTMHS